MVQHTEGRHHDLRFGYSIDDSARGLVICAWYANLVEPAQVAEIAPVYFRFLKDAQLASGRFHNFRDYQGHWLDSDGGDDPFGRSLWALGTLLGQPYDFGLRGAAEVMVAAARQNLSPGRLALRGVAYALLGVRQLSDPTLAQAFTRELITRYRAQASEDWPWFEGSLRYANGILPYALFLSTDPEGHRIARESLTFLNRVSRVDNVPVPIGNCGWYPRGGERALYDQQCIEAADMVLANLAAFARTGDARFRREAEDWYGWFWGNNSNQVVLVTEDGGCFDGVGPTDINFNQGAESTIAYLLAHLAMLRLVAPGQSILLY